MKMEMRDGCPRVSEAMGKKWNPPAFKHMLVSNISFVKNGIS